MNKAIFGIICGTLLGCAVVMTVGQRVMLRDHVRNAADAMRHCQDDLHGRILLQYDAQFVLSGCEIP